MSLNRRNWKNSIVVRDADGYVVKRFSTWTAARKFACNIPGSDVTKNNR